jgi:small subunit ribosomal protein S6
MLRKVDRDRDRDDRGGGFRGDREGGYRGDREGGGFRGGDREGGGFRGDRGPRRPRDDAETAAMED